MEVKTHSDFEGIDVPSKMHSHPIYKVYYQLNDLRLRSNRDTMSFYTKSMHYLLKLWEAIQILSLVLPLSHNRKTSDFDWFYLSILGIRTDYLSKRFDVELPNFIISALTIYLPIFIFILALLKSVKSSKPLSGSVLRISYILPIALLKLGMFVCILCTFLSQIASYTSEEY
jgi:hypothetical protein